MKILDIGCGSGRDMAELIKNCFDAYGVDASPEMVQYAQEKYPELKGRIEKGVLPNLEKPFSGEFNGIFCCAVLMHLPKEELFDPAFAIGKILKENGRPVFNIEFSSFAHHYEYYPRLCPPYSPWVKGKVEKIVTLYMKS